MKQHDQSSRPIVFLLLYSSLLFFVFCVISSFFRRKDSTGLLRARRTRWNFYSIWSYCRSHGCPRSNVLVCTLYICSILVDLHRVFSFPRLHLYILNTQYFCLCDTWPIRRSLFFQCIFAVWSYIISYILYILYILYIRMYGVWDERSSLTCGVHM